VEPGFEILMFQLVEPLAAAQALDFDPRVAGQELLAPHVFEKGPLQQSSRAFKCFIGPVLPMTPLPLPNSWTYQHVPTVLPWKTAACNHLLIPAPWHHVLTAPWHHVLTAPWHHAPTA